jgi:hypothetical protein
MAGKVLNFTTGATSSKIGDKPKVRIRVKDDVVQLRFTDRASTVNLDKTEILKDLGVKNNARRVGLPADIADRFENGTGFALENPKYGWYSLVPTEVAPDAKLTAA